MKDELSKEYLIEQYKSGKEVREIAKENNCGASTISRLNKKYNIDVYEYNPRYIYRNKEWLIEQFNKYSTLKGVCENTGYPKTSISRYAERYNIREKSYNRNFVNTIDEDYFKTIDCGNKAYFLGLIMADGCMYFNNSTNRYEFSIMLKDSDEDIIKKFANEVKFPLDKIIYRERKRKNSKTRSVIFRTYNKRFCENLINLGITPNKSGKEFIPEIDKKFILDFIRGYIDGDGWVLLNPRQNIGVCSTSKVILEQIYNIFNEITPMTTNIRLNKKIYMLTINKKTTMYRILKKLYTKDCISLDRKKKSAEKIINDYIKEFL